MKQHKTKRKRLLVLALCLLTALSMLPVTAMAGDSGTMNPAFTISKVEIEDTIEKDGRFTLKVTDNSGEEVTIKQLTDAGYMIKWEKANEEGQRESVSGGRDNMAEDMSWVNVAYDKGARKTYTVTVSKEETDSKSASRKVDWYDALQNGSFEDPALIYKTSPSSGKWFYNGIVQTSQGNVPHWRTTASDESIELGNVKKIDKIQYENPNYKPWFPWRPKYIYKDEVVTEKFYRCSSAVDGDQIAELNCDDTGALYQDVMTVPGETMNWNLSHRGRNGKDKMALVIAPLTGEHGAEHITTQAQLIQYISTNASNDAVCIVEMETDNTAWDTKSGTFIIPAGQFLTRFFFVAISTSSGDLREGNLLDYVWFSTEAVPPATGKGQLQIVKNIVGLDEKEVGELIEKNFITYQIGQDEPREAMLGMLELNEDNSYTATFTTDIEIPTNGEVTVRVVESEEEAKITNYNLVITEDATQTVTIKEKESKVISFTNTYTSTEPPQPDTGTLIVKKAVSGGGGDYNKEFTFTVKLKSPQRPEAKAMPLMSDMPNNGDPSGDVPGRPPVFESGGVEFVGIDDAIVGEFKLKDGQEQRFEEIPAGVTYTITESDNAGYTVTVNNTSEPSATGKIVAGETATVRFNNHKDGGYTPGPTYYPLTIQKVVTGLESVPAGYKATVNVMSKYSSVPTRTLMLEPNKPQTVHLPYGEYTLTETAPAVDGYKLTGQTFSENSFMLTYGGKNVTITNAYTKEQEEPVVIPDDPMVPEDDKPDKPSKAKDDTSKVPKTGDDTPLSLALYGLIAAGALLGIRKASKRKIK